MLQGRVNYQIVLLIVFCEKLTVTNHNINLAAFLIKDNTKTTFIPLFTDFHRMRAIA